MATCTHHAGRTSAGTKYNKQYCQPCLDGIKTSVAKVDAHVVPPGCFVTYHGSDRWDAISGTGCAHWVAHQLNISKTSLRCIDDKTLRVPDIIEGTATVARVDVRKGDIWAQNDRTHCGLVVNVTTRAGNPPNKVTIRHDSSAQGGVVENDFDQHFGGAGTFHR